MHFKKIAISILITMTSATAFGQSLLNKSYLKITPQESRGLDAMDKAQLKSLEFGLTDMQKEQIFQITDGEVDFFDHYVTRSQVPPKLKVQSLFF